MAYIGKSPTGTGVRSRYYYTATGGETSLSGADDNSNTLVFSDGNYVDVSLNGIALVAGTDYNTSTANTISGLSALSSGDIVEIVVYDIFTVADTVSAKDGGTFSGNVAMGGTLSVTGASTLTGDLTVDTDTLYVDSTNNNVGIGTTPDTVLHIQGENPTVTIQDTNDTGDAYIKFKNNSGTQRGFIQTAMTSDVMLFGTGTSERMRIDSSGNLLVAKTTSAIATAGHEFLNIGVAYHTRATGTVVFINRLTNDGNLIAFYQNSAQKGTISVSGTTVSYNGGHLSRFSQLADNTKDESIVKGTVMTNLDQMAEWTNDGVTEDNEQLNCMAVSSVEGDPNVAGVFVNWDDDDDIYTNDMNVAMTGDMVIRIAQGATVARGDLLMSAGDGTAKPQGDDIVRSKTIAKVTSTHVSHTYDDGSYLVACVLMAC